jgi:hypothetical protein
LPRRRSTAEDGRAGERGELLAETAAAEEWVVDRAAEFIELGGSH